MTKVKFYFLNLKNRIIFKFIKDFSEEAKDWIASLTTFVRDDVLESPRFSSFHPESLAMTLNPSLRVPTGRSNLGLDGFVPGPTASEAWLVLAMTNNRVFKKEIAIPRG